MQGKSKSWWWSSSVIQGNPNVIQYGNPSSVALWKQGAHVYVTLTESKWRRSWKQRAHVHVALTESKLRSPGCDGDRPFILRHKWSQAKSHVTQAKASYWLPDPSQAKFDLGRPEAKLVLGWTEAKSGNPSLLFKVTCIGFYKVKGSSSLLLKVTCTCALDLYEVTGRSSRQ